MADTTETGTAQVEERDLWSIFWRSFLLQGAFSFERMQSHGWCYTMMPLLEKLYDTKEEVSEALERHLVFFNTHPWMANLIMGVTASLEEEHASGSDEIEVGIVNDIKGALLGPLAGIGDSVLFSTWRTVTAGVAAALALDGQVIAPILFLVLFNVPHFYIRWWGTFKGYEYGIQAIEQLQGPRLRAYTRGAGIVGLFSVGALLANWVSVTTPLTYAPGGGEEQLLEIQSMLDGIFPGLLTLGFFLLALAGIRRGWGMNTVMLVLLVIGAAGGYLGLLS